jgi:hypothetical protein
MLALFHMGVMSWGQGRAGHGACISAAAGATCCMLAARAAAGAGATDMPNMPVPCSWCGTCAEPSVVMAEALASCCIYGCCSVLLDCPCCFIRGAQLLSWGMVAHAVPVAVAELAEL